MKEEDRQPQKFSPEEKRRQLEMLLQDVPRKEKQPETPYNQRDHTHCWQQKESPCGLKGKHRCCLCELPPPQPDTEVDVIEEPLHISAEALFKCQCKTKELLTSQQADWLRSEIEKLEGMKIDETPNPHIAQFHPLTMSAINHTLTSIITRYKEELLELEKGV